MTHGARHDYPHSHSPPPGSRPRTNTMLLGMETGAFKAANVVYIVNGSAVVRIEGKNRSWVFSLVEKKGVFVES